MEITPRTIATIIQLLSIAGLIFGSGIGYAIGRLKPQWMRSFMVILGASAVIHFMIAYNTFHTMGSHLDGGFAFGFFKILPIAASAFSIWYPAGSGLSYFNLTNSAPTYRSALIEFVSMPFALVSAIYFSSGYAALFIFVLGPILIAMYLGRKVIRFTLALWTVLAGASFFSLLSAIILGFAGERIE